MNQDDSIDESAFEDDNSHKQNIQQNRLPNRKTMRILAEEEEKEQSARSND